MTASPALTCQALLFDLDGTLIDSTDRVERLWRWWAGRHGVPFEQLKGKIHGRPAVESFRLIDPSLPIEQEVEELEAEEVRDMHDVRSIPGAHELLERLDPARWAIVTSGSPRVAHARIGYTGLPMPRVLITAAEIERGKPAPDGYLLGAQRLGFDPGDCIVVEDTPVGVEAGKAAGMRVVAIAFSHPPDELRSADAVVPDLAHLHIQQGPSGLSVAIAA
jgi:sugar-phosphatase